MNKKVFNIQQGKTDSVWHSDKNNQTFKKKENTVRNEQKKSFITKK